MVFTLNVLTMRVSCYKFSNYFSERQSYVSLSMELRMCGQIFLTILEASGIIVLLLLACVFVRREMNGNSPMT